MDDVAGAVSASVQEEPEPGIGDHVSHLPLYVFHPAVLRPGQHQLLPVGDVCCACKPDWRPQRGRTSILSQKTVPVWTAEEQFRFSFLTDVTQEVIMNPFLILMFCFSGALFLYAVLLYITKDYKLIPRGYVSKTDALQCDANQLLSDVLDVTTSQESGLVSRKLQALPVDEQRRLLRVLEVMIDER